MKTPKAKTTKVFQLKCEDASNVGGPMGREYTTTIFTRLFFKEEDAHGAAVKDGIERNAKDVPPLKQWTKHTSGRRSIDCSSVIYSITKTKIVIE